MNDQQANALFGEAAQLLHQGQATAALKILTKLDQAIPSNPGILYYIATAHSLTGSKHKAIQIYERVIRLNSRFIEAYNNIALDFAYLGEHQKAIAFLDHALEIKPDFIEALNHKACFLNALGEYPAAKKILTAALEINAKDGTTLANLSGTCIRLNELEDATKYSNELLRLNPNDHRAHNNLGKIFLLHEDYQNALNCFKKALDCNDSDVDNLADLANAYDELGNTELALQYLILAHKINPDHGTTHLNLGLHYHYQRNYPEAIKHLSTESNDRFRRSLREFNRGHSYLHGLMFEPGWVDYRWRWKESDLPIKYLETARSLWDGNETNRRVLIWHEQGVGDQILFGTLLHEAIKQAPNLFVRLDERLLPLYQRSLPSVHFIAPDSPPCDEDFEYHLPMADLGRLFRLDLNDFQGQPTNYLQAESTVER